MAGKLKWWILLGCAVVMIIAAFVIRGLSRTVEFIGNVETIEYKAEEKAYYFGVYDEFSDVACTIKATKDTGVKYLDKKVSVEEIRVGDRVSLDYRGKWESADKPLTAKWIKISYHLE